jgi:steroid 5-alpha reductase family enzyme
MEIMNTLGAATLILFFYMTVLFALAMIRRDNRVADVGWGPGFILVAWSTLFLSGSFTPRQLIAGMLVSIWGLRLAIRIYLRNRGKGEDPQYRQWRGKWGKVFVIRSYFQVFMLRGCLMLLIISPVLVINTYDLGNTGLGDFVGVFLWVLGFCFESLSDWQLDQFTSDPRTRGKIMDRGLWRYSRHPNYFGEVTMWWGLYVLALSVPWGRCSIIGPLTITFMILFLSGIPVTEKLMENSPAYNTYKKRTSVFIPWFLKEY